MSDSEEAPIQISMNRAGLSPAFRTRCGVRRGMKISSLGAAPGDGYNFRVQKLSNLIK
jgi:hypothetical protein